MIGGAGTLPEFGGVEKLPWYDYRYDIRSIWVESGIKYISEYCFSGCSNLEMIVFLGGNDKVPEFQNAKIFDNVPVSLTVYVPNDVIDHYNDVLGNNGLGERPVKPYTGVKLDKTEGAVFICSEFTLNVTEYDYSSAFKPEIPSPFNWSASPDGIVEFDKAYTKFKTFTGLSEGEATIAVEWKGYTAACVVTVYAYPEITVNGEAVSFQNCGYSIEVPFYQEYPVVGYDETIYNLEYKENYAKMGLLKIGENDYGFKITRKDDGASAEYPFKIIRSDTSVRGYLINSFSTECVYDEDGVTSKYYEYNVDFATEQIDIEFDLGDGYQLVSGSSGSVNGNILRNVSLNPGENEISYAVAKEGGVPENDQVIVNRFWDVIKEITVNGVPVDVDGGNNRIDIRVPEETESVEIKVSLNYPDDITYAHYWECDDYHQSQNSPKTVEFEAPDEGIFVPLHVILISYPDPTELSVQSYWLDIFREKTLLDKIEIDGHSITPYQPETEYSYTVPYETSSTEILVTPTEKYYIVSWGSDLSNAESNDNPRTVALAVGENSFPFFVIDNEFYWLQYNLTIIRQAAPPTPTPPSPPFVPSSDAGVQSIYVDNHLVSNYRYVVNSNVSRVNIVVYLSNYYAVISSGVIGLKNLSIGDNVFPFTVTAQDGTVRSYTLVVVRASNDATLKSLSVKDFPFAGEFHPDTINYRLSLPDSVSAIELSFEPNNPNSTVKITGNVSAIPSGVSTVTVEVTAQDGKTVRTYSVELNKSGEPETHLSTPLSASVVRVSFSGQTLQVNSPVSERVYVYSVAGSLLWRFDKPVGKAFFPISGTRQLLIVKGGSGWTEKMILVGD